MLDRKGGDLRRLFDAGLADVEKSGEPINPAIQSVIAAAGRAEMKEAAN